MSTNLNYNLNNLLRHPNVANLVELYEPIRHFGRALRGADSQPFLSDPHHARRIHHHHQDSVFSPDFDLRETPEAYFLEGEFPGIQDRSAIKLQWMDGHTLRIEGTIHETDLKKEWGIRLTGNREQEMEQPQHNATQSRKDMNEQNGIDKDEMVPTQIHDQRGSSSSMDSTEQQQELRMWLSERRVGLYVRNFSFPKSVDTNAIQARLSQGLLRIMVPKMDKSLFMSKEIHIETPEYSAWAT